MVPADGGVIVMGSGVNHGIFLMVMRQIRICRPRIEGELHYFHTGKIIAFKQGHDLRSYYTQVFGNNRKFSEGGEYRVKQHCSRSLGPCAVDSGFFAGRHMPGSFKTPEMIDTDDIKKLEHRPKPLDPPRVLLAPHR